MNFLRVDKPEDTKYDGWSFVDEDNCEYGVVLDEDATVGVVSLFADGEHKFEMYADDIPNMVKALQAAYKEYKGE